MAAFDEWRQGRSVVAEVARMLEGSTLTDGVAIARSVRSMARLARQVLGRPADEAGARELLEAIERLERQIEPGTSQDVGRWLAGLRRRVEGRGPTSA